MKTLRHTLTTLSLALTTLLTPALMMTGCQDDPLFSAPGMDGGGTATRAEVTNPGALRKEGNYWVANQRVPLVGVGRVIDDLNPGLVSANGGQGTFSNVTDLNLDNAASIDGITVGDLLYTPIFSVKDMYRTYAGGQTVGFVLGEGDGASLLDADVLGMLAIITYRDNENAKVYKLSEQGELLNLGLIGTTSGNTKQTLSVKVTEPFDEIMLCTTGVNANIGKGEKFYYAFVGETPEVKITNTEEGTFPNASFSNTVLINDPEDILKPGPEPQGYIGAGFIQIPILGALVDYHSTKLNLGTTIEPGTEIGFVYQTGTVADVAVGTNLTLTPYDADGDKIEEDIYEQVGILDVKAFGGGSGKYALISDEKVSAIELKVLSILHVDLGGTSLLRAYTRDPIVIDPTSYFTVPETVQTTSASYHFMKPSDGKIVSINIVDNPGGAATPVLPGSSSNYGYITNMEEGKTYQVEILYEGPDGKQFVTTTTITHVAGPEKTCRTHYMAGDGFSVANSNDFAGITILSIMENTDNITDNDYTTNYASVMNGVTVLEHGSYAVVASDEVLQPAAGETWRVGFTIQGGPGLLGLNALKFFTIALYDENGKKIDSQVSATNNTISLGLIDIGSEKMRVSIETTQAFKYVSLETAGLLDVGLNTFRIYNAFYEDASCEEEDVMDECSQLMSAALDNLKLDVDGFSGIKVSSISTSLADVVDEDSETCATMYTVANIGEFSLTFTFDERPAGQWIGLLMREPEGILSADLLNNIEVKTIGEDGQEEIFQNQFEGLLGLDLIGFGEKTYIEAYPTKPYCKLVVTFSGINAAGTWQFYGLYTTKDMNNNGKPDCTEPDPEVIRYVNLSTDTEHQCLDVNGSADLSVRVEYEGISTEETYYLGCFPTRGDKVVIPIKFNGNRLIAADTNKPLRLNEADIYTLRIYENEACTNEYEISNAPLLLYVHPRLTTWTGNANDQNWNNWSNWSEGSPWGCTDVIIPGNLGSNYPFLTEDDYDAGLNNCAHIHIEDGGQIVNTRYLNTYEGAWVDIKLKGGRYYMLSSPLEDMVSGDWFISPKVTLATDIENADNGLPYFSNLNDVSYPEGRTSPTIYQRLWSTSAPVKNPDGYNAPEIVTPDETQWTPPYNAVEQEYSLGMGFSLMAGKDNSGEYLFRFPKLHGTYHYYNLAGTPTGSPESIDRPYNYGKFLDDSDNAGREHLEFHETNTKANRYFLVGNPFVSCLNLSTFMATNGIREVKLFDGTTNTNNPLILIDGELVSSNGSAPRNIAPMEAFFALTPDGTEETDLTVRFTPDMQTSDYGTPAFTRSAAPALPSAALRLTAVRDGYTAHALLRIDDEASAAVVPGEDTRLLIEGEARPRVAVYTVADGQALDIQQVPDGPATIPLGFYLPDGGRADIRLTPDFTDSRWTDWFLLDLRTGQRRRLTPTTLTLQGVENGSGQYALTTDN